MDDPVTPGVPGDVPPPPGGGVPPPPPPGGPASPSLGGPGAGMPMGVPEEPPHEQILAALGRIEEKLATIAAKVGA